VPLPQKSDRSADRFEAHALEGEYGERSKGGLSTKVHAATDALGNPVRFILTGGEQNDITQIEPLLQGLKAGHVLGDKGYDGQRAMDAIAASGAKPVVPSRATTASWRTFDATVYKDRNLIVDRKRFDEHAQPISGPAIMTVAPRRDGGERRADSLAWAKRLATASHREVTQIKSYIARDCRYSVIRAASDICDTGLRAANRTRFSSHKPYIRP